MYNVVLYVVNEIRKWTQKPMVYVDFKDQMIEECKMEFGNVLRAMVGYHQLFSWFTWVTALIPIFGWILQMGANVSLYWFFTSG